MAGREMPQLRCCVGIGPQAPLSRTCAATASRSAFRPHQLASVKLSWLPHGCRCCYEQELTTLTRTPLEFNLGDGAKKSCLSSRFVRSMSRSSTSYPAAGWKISVSLKCNTAFARLIALPSAFLRLPSWPSNPGLRVVERFTQLMPQKLREPFSKAA